MNQIQVFENPEFGEIRTVTINGEPWFIGKDVAVILEYSNPRKAIIDHVDEEDKTDGVTIRDSMERGLMEIKERTINNPDGSTYITRTPKITGKGQRYFINKFLGGESRDAG